MKKTHLKSSSGFKSYVHPVAQLPTFHSHLLRSTGSEKNLSQIPARFRGLKAHRRTILFRRKQILRGGLIQGATQPVESKFFSSLATVQSARGSRCDGNVCRASWKFFSLLFSNRQEGN